MTVTVNSLKLRLHPHFLRGAVITMITVASLRGAVITMITVASFVTACYLVSLIIDWLCYVLEARKKRT